MLFRSPLLAYSSHPPLLPPPRRPLSGLTPPKFDPRMKRRTPPSVTAKLRHSRPGRPSWFSHVGTRPVGPPGLRVPPERSWRSQPAIEASPLTRTSHPNRTGSATFTVTANGCFQIKSSCESVRLFGIRGYWSGCSKTVEIFPSSKGGKME